MATVNDLFKACDHLDVLTLLHEGVPQRFRLVQRDPRDDDYPLRLVFLEGEHKGFSWWPDDVGTLTIVPTPAPAAPPAESARRAAEAKVVSESEDPPFGVKQHEPESEYADIARGLTFPLIADEIIGRLVVDHEWTRGGASALTDLALRYGRWMLQSAADLAEALDTEDGAEGF